tara:strand:+ start:546 stop:989 length:444 start_codon:yes stop_codon:yes gene_type:complete
MAFYGETDGLTGVNDVPQIHKNRTTTDRTCSGSFVDHITSSNLVVPSGYRGLIIAHFYSDGMFESEAGAYATRIRLTGSASSTPNETTGHQGYHDNYAGSAADFQAFDVGAGTYQVRIQVRERRGNVIFNNRGQTDSLTSTLITYRA